MHESTKAILSEIHSEIAAGSVPVEDYVSGINGEPLVERRVIKQDLVSVMDWHQNDKQAAGVFREIIEGIND